MAQLEFSLLYKHESQSSISSNHKKSWGLMTHPWNSLTGDARRIESLGLADQPIQLKQQAPLSVRDSVSKVRRMNKEDNQVEHERGRQPTMIQVFICMNVFKRTYTCAHRAGDGKRRGQGERRGERNAHTLMNTYTHTFAYTYTNAQYMNGKTSPQ